MISNTLMCVKITIVLIIYHHNTVIIVNCYNNNNIIAINIIIVFMHEPHLIGASLSEPYTNHYYEKVAVLMYVCSDTSSTCLQRMCAHTFNVDDHFHLEMIVNIHVCI